MRKLFILLLGIFFVAGTLHGTAATKSVTSAKIYLNPGHGSWGPNDRPMATIPYPFLASTGRPDTCGFYESNTNLWKVLRMRLALLDLGMKSSNIKLSRWANGPYPYVAGASNATMYNRNLSEICEEVDAWGADMFFSVHSDAATDGSTANRSLYLYRGTDASNYVAGSKAMAQALWTRAYVGTNGIDYASSTSTNIRGDISFYGSSSTRTGSNGNKYTGYLGVLKHGIPGFLAEGYCHTYQPARHRALNSDYCGQEGVRYSRGVADYFGWTADSKGYIMGFVKDKSKSVNNSLYTYKSGTRAGDEYWPVMGATVSLYQDGTLIDTYTTDNNYNGVFVFERLNPGSYTLIVRANGYNDHTETVSVTANETTYPRIYVTPGSGTDPDPQPAEKIKGIFAYNLNLVKGENHTFTFSFNANSDALSGRIIFTDSISGQTIGSVALDEVKEGQNSFTFTNDQLPEAAGEDQVLNWSVELTGKPITAITRLNDTGSAYNYTRASVTVDNSPESDYFGSIYVNDLKTRNSSSSNANNRDNGIYRYNPLWQRENATPYTGNMAWDNNFRITTDYKGTLYIPDFGDNHSGVFIAYPDRMGDTWQNFFAGSRTVSGDLAGLITNNGVNTGSSSPSAYVCGSGASSKLYVSLEDMDNRVYCYDLGSQMDENGNLPAKWYTEPELVHNKTDLKYTNKNVIAQEDGAVWIAENLYITSGSQDNLATQPALRYITPLHDDYWSYATNSNTPVTNLNGCAGGGFVITPDGSQIIIVDGDGVLQFFNVGGTREKPLLSWQKSFTADARDSGCTSVGGGRVPNGVYQMAFDWGGNLYVAGGSLGVYSMPTNSNTHVTPAKRSMTLTKGEVVIPEPEPYVIKKDIDTYDDNEDLSLTSAWVRSVKEEYNNIVFDESGIRNRGFAVSGDKVFIAARSENATDADLFLLTLDQRTGESLGRINLSNEAQVELYGCNDVLIDAAGNMVISNLTTDLASAPLQLFQVDTITGGVTRVAQLTTITNGVRIDHCNIVGDVTTGNFTVMAAQASGKRLFSWTVAGGEVAEPVVVEAQAFYPATATHFGIAPRIYPIDATHAYVTGSTVHPTLYDLTDGSIIDSFGNNEEIKPNGLYANGLTTFAMGSRQFMVYPSEDYRSTEGNKFTLAVSDSGDVAFEHLRKVFEFPKRGLGAVHSQTWGAPISAEVSEDGRSAQIVVYVPGEGLASYTLGDLSPEPIEEYVIKKDIDTYADTLGLSLASNWVRSVKDEYDNIEFEQQGILNRGFAVSGDVVYVSNRSANATYADISLLRFERATGRSLEPLALGDEARVPYYACNDVLTDNAGNLLVANLSLNIATTPLQLFVVDTVSGNVTKVAELAKANAEGARIDHCGVWGDLTSGNFTVMAAQASGKRIVTWTVEGGEVTKSNVVEVAALYPATASNFGIAPRIFPTSDTTAYVSGSNTHLTLYHVNTGEILDSFANNADLTPVGIQANGYAAFSLAGKRFMLFPSEDYRGTEGNKFMIAMSDGNSLEFAHLTPAFEFPKRGLGAVHSQTWGALIAAEPNEVERTADITIYVPGEGLASYTLTVNEAILRGDVNGDGVVSGADVTALYNVLLDNAEVAGDADVNGDGVISGADVTALYNLLLGN